MEQKDKDLIQRNLTQLVAKTKWNSKLQAALIENKVFSAKLLDPVQSLSSQDERNQKLYLDVMRRGPKAFQGLVKSLTESENQHAAKVLRPDLDLPSPSGVQPRSAPMPRESKVWNEPRYEIPAPLELPPPVPEYQEAEERDERTPVTVKVIPSKQFKVGPRVYPMTKKTRGMCLIIDNEVFEGPHELTKRTGSLIDANNLDILFEGLGFKVVLKRNRTSADIRKDVVSFASTSEHKEAEMCVVCVLSHGENGLIFGSDERQVQIEWLLGRFNNEGCPALKGKPKFFIFQACRGDEADFGYVPRIDLREGPLTETDAKAVLPASRVVHKDPTWEDMLIAYATVPGYVANRNFFRGTWFVESICEVFMSNACELDIREMLDLVAENLKTYEAENGTKQACTYEVRHFTKKLYFNPGLHGDPRHINARLNAITLNSSVPSSTLSNFHQNRKKGFSLPLNKPETGTTMAATVTDGGGGNSRSTQNLDSGKKLFMSRKGPSHKVKSSKGLREPNDDNNETSDNTTTKDSSASPPSPLVDSPDNASLKN